MSVCQQSQPVITCRCCGKAVDAKYQPGLGRKLGYWLLTCLNVDCTLYYFTFGSPDYRTLDLSDYLKDKAHD